MTHRVVKLFHEVVILGTRCYFSDKQALLTSTVYWLDWKRLHTMTHEVIHSFTKFQWTIGKKWLFIFIEVDDENGLVISFMLKWQGTKIKSERGLNINFAFYMHDIKGRWCPCCRQLSPLTVLKGGQIHSEVTHWFVIICEYLYQRPLHWFHGQCCPPGGFKTKTLHPSNVSLHLWGSQHLATEL